MQRIGQRLFTGIAILLLMLCLVATFFWVRGRAVNDEIYLNIRSHLVIAGSFPNHLDLVVFHAGFHGPLVQIFLHDKRVPPRPEYWNFRLNGNAHKTEVAIPWWLVLVVGLTVPAIELSRRMQRSSVLRRGGCPNCGYDLRATPQRCPECGAVPQHAVNLTSPAPP